MGVNLASFKNSRNYPRPATTSAATTEQTVVGSAGPLGLPLLAADPNRTYAEIYNRHATDSFKFAYQDNGAPVPTIAQILATGFEVIAGAAYEIDAPTTVWAVSTTVNPIPVDVDKGVG
jgi:hypothetical protein